ncbi:unnamed protein product [Chilo suppressalis]|uniref:RHD domain-containing protein n=1 Tax=Chilo suppressalis TaxID=168631 RepID=A0ABN8EEB8_CHISP|nr:unnamed protein product [Chilo suppressalis]
MCLPLLVPPDKLTLGAYLAHGPEIEHNVGEQSAHLSDVVELILADDPSLGRDGSSPGSGLPPPAPIAVMQAPAPTSAPAPAPYVYIVEQPAPKSLRFRYECEGRSAGSIPGVHSTPENKTFPTIKVCGYKGCMVIVVSCVTKDEPYKPHPHNLVGRDCNRGVCTVKVHTEGDADAFHVQFKNLGIQCVKKRDITEALRVRQEMRVNPFKTGYGHKSQPQSIDLNAVRLCFQVFLTDESYKVQRALQPVVSDVVYDKKAMSELLIVRSSHCSGPVRGGTTVILLCEKVTREDTEIWFFHEDWVEKVPPEFVHKQLAVVFKTPPYRDQSIARPITVQFQLHRVSDHAKSNVYSFEYIPEGQGTRKPLPDLASLAALLPSNLPPTSTPVAQPTPDTNNNEQALVSSTSDTLSPEDSASLTIDMNGNNGDAEMPDSNERSLNELLDQVAELDEIYTENRTRLENMSSLNDDDLEDFNDAGTYTSLQLAFRNPVAISEPPPNPNYEDTAISYRGPIIEFAPLKRDTDDKAPPLPPKRVRKVSTTEPFKTSQTSVDSILKPGRMLPVTRNPEVLVTKQNELTVARSEPALPPVKKRSFFSRLFRRKEKSPAPSVKSEGRKEKRSKPVGRSVSSVSGQRPSRFKSSVSHTSLKDNASNAGLSYADSITHISLHADEDEKSASQPCLGPLGTGMPDGTILVAESVLALDANAFKKLQDDLELTEAEHYALYMAVAPHATASEFDETSCYYSPVDASKFHN